VKAGGDTGVRLSAAYSLNKFDGWIITRHAAGQREENGPVFLTT